MRIVVLMKPIHDPLVPIAVEELAQSDFGQRESHPAFGPYDENALETALQIADQIPGTAITVVSFFDDEQEPLLRTALAAGSTEVVWVRGDSWTLSALQVGLVLANTIRQLDGVQAVLAGVQSGDWDSGLVPMVVGAALEWPFVPMVLTVRYELGGWRLASRGDHGPLSVTTEFPWVASVTSTGHNRLRYPTLQDRFQAKRKPVTQVLPDLDQLSPPLAVRFGLVPMVPRQTAFVTGASDEDKGRSLVTILRERQWT